MILFATSNKYKAQEIAAILAEYGIELQQHKIELQEINSSSPKQVALHKAKQAFAKLKQPLIVEDTAIYFKAYKGFPGTMPKRVFECLGFEGLLKLLWGESRDAYFLCTICFIENQNSCHFFEGKLEGKISEKVIKPKADVMPYEKISIPKGSKRALAELTREEKNRISHRAIAARKLGAWLKEKALHDLIDSI